MNYTKDDLIKAYEEYVEFLGKHLSEKESFLRNRSVYTSKDVLQEGIDKRKHIEDIKKLLSGKKG